MIELLLHAEKALSIGALDQAERMYWQSIERDARNPIAVTGLARIALQRGDHETARLFALKALAIDPENPTARRLMQAFDGNAEEAAVVADLPQLAVEDLEAISRRRRADEGQPESDATYPDPDDAEPAAVSPESDMLAPAPAAASPEPELQPTLSADDFAAAEAAATLEAIDSIDDSVVLQPLKPRFSGRPRLGRGIRIPSLPRLAENPPPVAPPEPSQIERIAPSAEPPDGVPSASPSNGTSEADAEAAAHAEAMAEPEAAESEPAEPEADDAIRWPEPDESPRVPAPAQAETLRPAPAATHPSPSATAPPGSSAARKQPAGENAQKGKKPGVIRRMLRF